jgi:UDPglucose--hexose-1-phosphate uridylyltransferase
MPELRQEPVTKKWVVIATERSKRPSDFPVRQKTRKGGSSCPFCKGNEDKTPPEVMSFREAGTKPDTPGWWIRVVPNKFPALDPQATGSPKHDFYLTLPGSGVHEVLIESPEHDSSLEKHSLQQVNEIFRAWRARYQALINHETIRYVQIFKNEGAVAGASLEHPHSQLIATPIIPPVIAEELQGAQEYYGERGNCLYCEMIEREQREKIRIVIENNDFLAFCPYASRFPFETWIIPKQHQAGFEAIDDRMLQSLSEIVQGTLQRLTGSLNNAPYNMVLHAAPAGYSDVQFYHWHLEILPRLTIVAGFEWGTGIIINPTPPEAAAQYLQDTDIQNNQEKEVLSWQQIH